jgi:hypothetical protein
MKLLTDYWANCSFWDKIYIIYAIVICLTICIFIIQNILRRPRTLLKRIEKATKEGCMTVGKMTCFTLHGNGKEEYYQAEYMYIVEDKKYFVTYQMACNVPIDNSKDFLNADMMLLNIKSAIILFYDKQNPKKVISKIEVFTSEDGIHQIPTSKRNVWRDIDKDWSTPINLVSY